VATGSVRVSLGSVRRAWRDSGGGEFWLQLRTRDRSRADDLFTVLEDANVAQGDEGVYTQLGSASPHGFVTMVDSVRDDAQLEA
jgi:hypothetical protein